MKLELFSCALILCAISNQSTALAGSSYTVPVPPALQGVATFPVSNMEYAKTGGHIYLRYDLPVELTGVAHQTISMEGADTGESSVLSGPKGTANCTMHDFSAACKVRMQNLEFDSENLSKRLGEISSTPGELDARMQVAHLFSSDPIGVVRYERDPGIDSTYR